MSLKIIFEPGLSLLAAISVATCALGCGQPSISPVAQPSPGPVASAEASPPPPVVHAPRPEPDDAPPPLSSARPAGPGPLPDRGGCRPMPFLPGECDPRPPDDAFLDAAEVTAWFAARGTKEPKLPADATTGACFVLPAGNGGEEAMVCSSTRIEQRGGLRMTGLSTYRRVDRVRAFVVRAKRLVKLLDAPLLFDMMDKDELENGPLFALRITRDDRGLPVVREPSEGACERARAHNAEARATAGGEPAAQRWAVFDRGLVERLCKAAGKGLPAPSASQSSF